MAQQADIVDAQRKFSAVNMLVAQGFERSAGGAGVHRENRANEEQALGILERDLGALAHALRRTRLEPAVCADLAAVRALAAAPYAPGARSAAILALAFKVVQIKGALAYGTTGTPCALEIPDERFFEIFGATEWASVLCSVPPTAPPPTPPPAPTPEEAARGGLALLEGVLEALAKEKGADQIYEPLVVQRVAARKMRAEAVTGAFVVKLLFGGIDAMMLYGALRYRTGE